MMHGNDWQGQDVSGWWCSEKFNGWRAYWTGERLVSRTGRDYDAPVWFTSGLPSYPLDGELWLGRGCNHNDVNRAIAAEEWHRLKLVAFDIPGMIAESAIRALQGLNLGSYAIPASFNTVQNATVARAAALAVIHDGGEGVMLRKPGSQYRNTRCDDLLKLKG